MADDITYTSTSPAGVPNSTKQATDEHATRGHMPIVKLAYSADGDATQVTADANGLEVQGAGVAGTPAGGVVSVQGVSSGTALAVSAASLPLPSGASTSAKQDTQITAEQAIQTAAELIDDAVYTDGTGTVSKGIAVFGQDGTNPQAIKTDASGELQVDVLSIAAGTNAIGKLAANSGVDIGDVDILSIAAGDNNIGNVDVVTLPALAAGTNNIGDVDVLTLPGSLTGYAEDAAHNSGDVGVQALAVRKDTGAAIAGTDGDYTPLQVDSSGNLRVNVVTGGGTGGTATTDDGAFTAASGSGTPMMGFVTADSVDSGDVGVVGMLANRQLKVTLYDSGGVELAVGGGTQYTEDAAAAANPVGNALMLVREDARAGTLVSADGDNVAARGNNKGELYVKTTDSDALLTTIDTDTSNISTKIDTVAGAVAGTEMQVDVVAALPAGTNAIGKLAANSGVDIGDVDVTSVIPGTGATNLGKAIDTATGGTDTGVLVLATRDDALGALTPIEGDNVQLRTDANGALWTHDDALDAALSGSELQVDVVGALPAGTNAIGKLAANSGVDIGDVDITSVVTGTGATNLGKAEDGAHTSGDVGVLSLGVRNDTPNTATTGADADYSQLSTDRVGGIRTALYETDFAVLGTNHVKKYYTNAGAVTDGIVWSPAAGKRWYVTDIFINVSAAATVTLEDDLVGGDSAVWKAELAANSGWSHSFQTPLFSGEDAADLLVTTSAANVYIMVTGYEI